MSETKYIYKTASSPLSWVFAIFTSIVGYTINDSLFWAVVDFFFWPFAWIKWLICHEVSLSIIKESFSFFLK